VSDGYGNHWTHHHHGPLAGSNGPLWDVILQYTGTDGDHATWYPYGSELKEWTRIIDDLFEPGILNPGEEMMIQVSVLPPVASPTTNVATIATPNGITVSAVFTYSVP
jgi:hypothetical protein